MTFRGCRYEVHVVPPNAEKSTGRWSRHSSLVAAKRSYREAVNNQRGDHTAGSVAELWDVEGSALILEREMVRSW